MEIAAAAYIGYKTEDKEKALVSPSMSPTNEGSRGV